jgi:hypothetical protein
MNVLNRLYENDEEVTITALADAFKFKDKAIYLFLTGPMKNLESLQQYFKGRGGKKLNAFATAVLGPVPTSPIDAVTHKQQVAKLKDAWWATRHMRQSIERSASEEPTGGVRSPLEAAPDMLTQPSCKSTIIVLDL